MPIIDHPPEIVDVVLEWVAGLRPDAGPPPRSVCDWLVDLAQGALERMDYDGAFAAGCELVLIANGERSPRPRPAGVERRGSPVATAATAATAAGRSCATRWIPVEDEPIVRYALEVFR